MDINNIAIESIRSDYIKEYLTNIHHQFTLEEQATIIYNSDIVLEDKMHIFENILNRALKQNNKQTVDSINEIIAEIKEINHIINGADDKILVYEGDIQTYCSKGLKNLIEKIHIENNKVYNVDIHNIDTVEIIGCISLNNKYEPISYELESTKDNYIKNMYVNVPTDIKIGDIVYEVGSTTEYVVVNNISNCNMQLDYTDDSIIVIPRCVLNSTEDYRKQIEKIYEIRISNIENPCAEPDIIMQNNMTLSIFNVTK